MATQSVELSSSNTLVGISMPLEANLDIIAVHGMNTFGNETHAENTWTHERTRVNWLRDLLPQRLPNARILAFQYNANVAFGASAAGVKEQAINLLRCLELKRKLNPTRPIIFIAHSLGGVLVKEALATALQEHEMYSMIWTFTYAVFFLAVPHQGSHLAAWGQLCASVYLTATLQPRNSLLRSVTPNSEYNRDLGARFKPLHEAYKFYSWMEALPLRPFGIVVPPECATLDLPLIREERRICQRDHRTICKFSAQEDPEWIELSATIADAARTATTSFNYTATMDYRRAMGSSQELQDEILEGEDVSLAEASNEARDALQLISTFHSSQELLQKDDEAENAGNTISTLASLLLITITPVLGVLAAAPIGLLLLNMAWRSLMAVLPSKEDTLRKVDTGLEAERTIMRVEEWAIRRLNELNSGSLQASHKLEHAIALHELEAQNDSSTMVLTNALHLRQQLRIKTEFVIENLHKRHQTYNKAEVAWKKIEDARKEIADKDDRDFWIAGAEFIQKERNAPAIRQNEGGSCCAIM